MAYVYWLRRNTWRALWVAVRRAPKDSAARRNAFRLFGSFFAFIAWLVYMTAMFRGYALEFGRIGDLIIGVYLFGFTLLVTYPYVSGYFEHRAAERSTPSVSPELKLTLFSEACLLATLLERLASESYMEKEIPSEIIVTTRRVLLDRLTSLGLRDGLEPWLLDLLLAPDGHWTDEQKNRAIPAFECFACLRWALGLGGIRDLTDEPRYSIDEARSLVEIKKPEKLLALPSWEIRPARNMADSFFSRCWVELIARREIDATSEQYAEEAIKARARIAEADYTKDYLIGARTVSELETALLFEATRRAYTRYTFLSLLVDVLCGDSPPDEIRKFLERYFSPTEPNEDDSASHAEQS